MKLFSFASAALLSAVCLMTLGCSGNNTKNIKETETDSLEVAEDMVPEEVVTLEIPEGEETLTLSSDSILRPGVQLQKIAILDFNATWCGPCQSFSPAFHNMASKYAKDVDFVSIDIDENPLTAEAFGIQSIPTVIVLVPGQTEKIFVGTEDLLPEEKFEKIVLQAIAANSDVKAD